MAGTTDGLKTAAQLAMDALPAPPFPEAPAAQLPLLADGDLVQTGAPRPNEDAIRGRGRPAGARNKRTEDWTRYILGKYTSPLEVLAQIATMPIDEIAKLADCKRLEAFQEKRQAATALLPYLHQRQPLAVNLSEHKVVNLTIVASDASAPPPTHGVMTLQAQILEANEISELEQPIEGATNGEATNT